jgi:hypothetical protein
MLSNRTSAKPSELRKDEPHPMGLLAPIGKLINHLTEDLLLRVQEPNKVRIGHPRIVVQATAVFELRFDPRVLPDQQRGLIFLGGSNRILK